MIQTKISQLKEATMQGKVIKHKGFEILHNHVFNWVFFSAWKGDRKVWNKEVRVDNRDIDWDNPLTEDEKDFLIHGALL